ncbi:MAG: hypothetical protein IAG13_27265 [Deltaproteobacteria bacterium]|nr:hypothetical protein [Nannocystaceae bacterium]
MSRVGKNVVALAVVGGLAFGTWTLGQRLFGDDEVGGEGARHAVNQVWIERVPADQRDMINHFVLIKHPQGKVGGFGKSSQWRHFVELFQWGLEGERLSVFLPQERTKAQLKVRTWECAGEAPDPFELCLELSNGKRSMQMYSRKDWVIEPHDVEGSIAAIAEEQPELAAVLRGDDGLAVDAAPVEDAERWPEIDLLER